MKKQAKEMMGLGLQMGIQFFRSFNPQKSSPVPNLGFDLLTGTGSELNLGSNW